MFRIKKTESWRREFQNLKVDDSTLSWRRKSRKFCFDQKLKVDAQNSEIPKLTPIIKKTES